MQRPLLEPTVSDSGTSVYFEAPLAHFHMAQDIQDSNLPIANGAQESNLNREPTVATGLKPIVASSNGVLGNEVVDEDNDPDFADEPNDITAHPNGSEGWLPATDLPPVSDRVASPMQSQPRSASVLKKRRPGSIASRASSVRGGATVERNRSTRSVGSARSTSRRSMFTDSEGKPVNGSTFINGAGVTGPSATAVPDDSLHKRMQSADSALNAKQKKKIGKTEVIEGRRLSKVIKRESKVEKQSLEVSVKELGELQQIQQAAIKREAKAHTAHTKSVTAFQKAEEVYLAARTKFEIAQAAMAAEAESLEIARNNARAATERMQDKATEIDGLRKVFGVDEREREVALGDLKGKPKGGKGSGFWR